MYQKMYRFIENQRQKTKNALSPIEVKSIVYFCLHLTICEDHLRKQRLFRVLFNTEKAVVPQTRSVRESEPVLI